MNFLAKSILGGFGIKLKQFPNESISDPKPLYGGTLIIVFFYFF